MLELYKLLDSIINPLCPNYSDHYPETKTKVYPYSETKLGDALPNNSFSDNIPLAIDIWDNKGTDIREIEGIADSIHKALNRLQYNDQTMNISINRDKPYRLSLLDSAPHIQRRELRYIITVYYK